MSDVMTETELDIDIQPTPNPNALKFIMNIPVKLEGNSTYKSPSECGENQLALELFKVRGIDQLHFFENVIAVTKFSYEDWNSVEVGVTKTLKEFMPVHNPDYNEDEPQTYISSPDFIEQIQGRGREFGKNINTKYAEGFTSKKILGVDNLMDLR